MNDETIIYRQDIINIRTSKNLYSEALVRKYKGIKGAENILREVYGAKGEVEFDIEILKRALKASDEAGDIQRIGVNLCKETMKSQYAVDEVIDIYREANVGCKLIIEVTEHTNMLHKEVSDNMQKLRQNGIAIALDDFGTNKANICSLLCSDIDIVKVDKMFIKEASKGRVSNSRIVLADISRMCSRLGVKTVIEGVETDEDLRIAKDLGYENIQGYYYSIPYDIKTKQTKKAFAI